MRNRVWRWRLVLAGWLMGETAFDVVDAYHAGYEAGAEAAQRALASVLGQDYVPLPHFRTRVKRN